MTEGMSVVELHDAPSRPGAVRSGPGVTLYRDHFVTPARQAGADEQAGRTRPDDGYPHANHIRSFDTLTM
jgi:hypothetical protein